MLGASLVLGVIVDPIRGRTPWWEVPRQGALWEALGPPLILWLCVAGTIVVLGTAWGVQSSSGKTLLAAMVWGSSFPLWLLWGLILQDAFPEAPLSWIAFWTALAVLFLILAVGLGRLVRRMLMTTGSATAG